MSSVGWLYDDMETVRQMARLSAEVTHNHPEGLKGAEATAGAIFLARAGHSKVEIKAYAESLGYDLSRTCDVIRPNYRHVESCQETVPEAITAFLEGESFEDVIRTAVSLGGDCDTLTCIAGSIAEAFYGVPDELWEMAVPYCTADILAVVSAWEAAVGEHDLVDMEVGHGGRQLQNGCVGDGAAGVVEADGDVTCGNVEGNISAGGDVTIRK